PEGNEGLDGNPIPAVFGRFRVKSADFIGATVAEAPDTNYLHSLFVISEGRCQSVSVHSVNGDQADNDNPSSPANDDALIYWGIESLDQDAVTSGELTQLQQKQAIGSRESFHQRKNTRTDTYQTK